MADQSFWINLGKSLFQLFLNKEKEDNEKGKKKTLAPTEIAVSIPIDGTPTEAVPQETPAIGVRPFIDWTSATSNVTDHFLVGDCIALHAWNRLATAEDGLTEDGKQKLIALCVKMEQVRAFLGCSINVHCMFRSQDYNAKVVKAIPNDVHAQNLAVDFDCNGHYTIDELHAKLEPELERFGMRMERNTPTWVHLDLHAVVNARYFNA